VAGTYHAGTRADRGARPRWVRVKCVQGLRHIDRDQGWLLLPGHGETTDWGAGEAIRQARPPALMTHADVNLANSSASMHPNRCSALSSSQMAIGSMDIPIRQLARCPISPLTVRDRPLKAGRVRSPAGAAGSHYDGIARPTPSLGTCPVVPLSSLSSSGSWATKEFRCLGDMIVRRRCRWRSSSGVGGCLAAGAVQARHERYHQDRPKWNVRDQL
jgi:hypothetical protein